MSSTNAADWQTRLGLDYTPSSYQAAIFDFVADGDGNGMAVAVAGAGKSTSLAAAVRIATWRSRYVLALAFNVEAKDALVEKLEGTGARVKTVHSHGYACLCYTFRGCDVVASKYRDVVDSYIAEFEAAQTLAGDDCSPEEIKAILDDGYPRAAILKLLDFARLDLLDASADDFGRDLRRLADHHDVDVDPVLGQLVTDVVRLAMRWGADNPRIVDYTDMVWLPTVLRLRPWTADWTFVDEAQDISKAHRALIRASMKRRGRALFVGDPCQPEGTIVATPDGPRSIEDLREGDLVVSCDVRSSAFIQKGKRITGITSRPYRDDLVVADAGDRKSRYTLNHRCVVRFSGLRDKWCVYMQRRGSQYRVGKCAMDYRHVSGPVARARAEGADALWILDVFDTEAEAFEAEAMVSAVHGLPQLRFVDGFGSQVLPQSALDRIWDEVGSNQSSAAAALRRFGRSLRWPLFDFETPEHSLTGSAQQMSLKRPIIVRACNLVDGVELLRYEGRGHYRASQWTPVTITREPYHGFVYSMDVEKYELYVADGLLTHNCQAIYGFAGADADSFQAIVDEFECSILPLSVCYRCPTSVLDLAREIVPQIEARPGAPAGVVRRSTTDELLDEARRGDMVLCRLNAPLLSLAFKLIGNGVSAAVRGRADLGKGLAKIIDRCARAGWDGFKLALEAWEDREREDARKRYGKRSEDALAAKLEAISDQAECIRVIWGSCGAKSADDLKSAIARLFADKDPKVVLSSIHRAKGLEAPRVFVALPERLGDAWPNSQPWVVEQEKNLEYVAYTRAQEELVFLDGCPERWMLDKPEDDAPAHSADPIAAADDGQARISGPCTACGVDVVGFPVLSVVQSLRGPGHHRHVDCVLPGHSAGESVSNHAPLPPVADDAPDIYDPMSKAARQTLARALDSKLRELGFAPSLPEVSVSWESEIAYTRTRGDLVCKVYSTIVNGEVRGIGKDAIRVALTRDGRGVGKAKRVNRVGKIDAIVGRVVSRIESLTGEK